MLRSRFKFSVVLMFVILLAFSGMVMAESVQDEWQDYILSEEGFALSLPADWISVDLDPEMLDQSVQTIVKENPGMASITTQLQGLVANKALKFLALAMSDPKADFPSSINLIKQELPGEVSLDEMAALTQKQLEKMSNLEKPITHTRIKTASFEVEEFRYGMKMKNGKQTLQISIIQYVFMNENNMFVITASAPKNQMTKYSPLFKQVLESFQLVEEESEAITTDDEADQCEDVDEAAGDEAADDEAGDETEAD